MIKLENISGGYGKSIVVSDICAEFENGKITSVIGANGCGKSTLLMLCAGLITPKSGRVIVDGDDISKLSRNAAARRISYLAQGKAPENMSVRSMVAHGRFPYLGYPRKYTKDDIGKINEAIELAGIGDICERSVVELSGGQQQRVRIAMMLAQDTHTVLLDEPMTYLDIRHQLELMELIIKLKEMGKAIVAVMHDLNLALRYSDQLAVINKGRIIAQDTPENISKSDALNSALGVEAVYCDNAKQYFFDIPQ